MRMNSPLWLALAAGAAIGALAGCQTYDFEPVTPLIVQKTEVAVDVAAAPPKPNMMLLVDKSGSMDDPIDTSDPDCGGCKGQSCNQATCPTRWEEMRKAMQQFLTDPDAGGTLARYGIAMFPEKPPAGTAIPSCAPTVSPRLDIPGIGDTRDELLSSAQAAYRVIESIQSIGDSEISDTTTGGGTPTSKSLSVLGKLASLNAGDQRTDVVLLLTDGQPNCNPDNPNSYMSDPAACRCTVVNQTTGLLACDVASYDRRGCLDKDVSVDVVRNLLREQGIRTIVIGFGADTTAGTGAEVMNAMAEQGGFPRRCDDNNQCGAGDTCNTEARVCGGAAVQGSGQPCSVDGDCFNGEKCEVAPICQRKFYAAKNSAELIAALREIATVVGTSVCEFPLTQTPEDMNLLIVKLNDQKLQAGADTWEYDDGKVVFQGAACETIKAGNTQTPAKVNIQLVNPG